ncbi:MAG: RNA 2',3'-cyclic phosphodiesterase [Solirubrobacteraceae bacterium]
MSDSRARLFVALELPPDVRAALHAWAREQAAAVQHLRVVDPSSLHVTLCFLGSRPATEVGEIAAACRAVASLAAPALTLGDGLWLPPRRPRVLTVDLADEAGRLAAIQSVLSDALVAEAWYESEARPFLAHVTVARVQRDARVRPPQIPAPESVRFTGRHVTLYQSRLGQGSARYEALARVTLPP